MSVYTYSDTGNWYISFYRPGDPYLPDVTAFAQDIIEKLGLAGKDVSSNIFEVQADIRKYPERAWELGIPVTVDPKYMPDWGEPAWFTDKLDDGFKVIKENIDIRDWGS